MMTKGLRLAKVSRNFNQRWGTSLLILAHNPLHQRRTGPVANAAGVDQPPEPSLTEGATELLRTAIA
jgi:hypothetical protein